jgi:LacI family transcriptional regulator
MGNKVKTRLADVAKLAGVSIGSASKALSVPTSVKPATLAAVQNAAEQLGYVPNGAARALASGRTSTLGVLVPTLANPVYALFTQAAQRACAARDYRLIVTTDEYDWDVGRRNVRELIEQRVAGLILIGADHHPDVAMAIERARVPHIFAWSYDESRGRGCVGFSNRAAVLSIVRHLLDLGHRRFGVLTGDPLHNERARSRLEGIRDALKIAGCDLDPQATILCPFTINAGREGMTRLLGLEQRPTAIICGTDLLAAGALAEAKARHVAVPDEMSISGFDDIDFAGLLDPPLTTIRVPAIEMGNRAVVALTERITSGQVMVDVELPADLILRGSTGPVAAAGKGA